MTQSPLQRSILVGVTARQPEIVIRVAARLARALDADLVCAHVDPSAYVVEEHADGSVESRPVDPDVQEWTGSRFDPALAERLERLAGAADVRLRMVELAGEVGRALDRLAEVLDAELIVVGSRSGVRANLREYFGGSVAVHLAHRQPRPIMIVPLAAKPEGLLPWEEG